jgi:uncharacterized protein (TIGR02466 family)
MITIFPCIIHTFFLENFSYHKNDLISYVHQEKSKSSGVKKSNAGGWQSTDDYNQKEDNLIKSLIDTQLESFFANKQIFNNFSTAKMNSMWLNCNDTGNYNHSHNHPGCDLSGVLWLKVPKNSGNIVFESPCSFQQYKTLSNYSEEFKKSTNAYDWFYVEPQEGLMILFPSHLNHSVTSNKSDQERISVDFNKSFS